MHFFVSASAPLLEEQPIKIFNFHSQKFFLSGFLHLLELQEKPHSPQTHLARCWAIPSPGNLNWNIFNGWWWWWHLLPHIVPMLVLDVLRHVLQDQPVHVWAELSVGWPVGYKNTKLWPSQKNWVTPKNWVTAWWLCKDRGQRVGFWDPFIESLGVWAREGALRTGLHVTVAIHSQELTHMMVMMLVSLVMRCILYGAYFVTMAQSGNFSLNFWTNGIFSINCHAVTFSLSSESSYERRGQCGFLIWSGGQKRWYIFGHLKIQLKGSAG